MARDDNDRSYDDGQGRPVNPDLTGDVLSPRWSTDDTDEQPAIQVQGSETYILPPDSSSTSADPYPVHGEYDYGGQAEGAYADSSYDYGDGVSDPRAGDYQDQQGAYAESQYAETQYAETQYAEAQYSEAQYSEGQYTEAQYSETEYTEAAYTDDAPGDRRESDQDDPGYLPLDRAYDEPEEEPKRGFLGSGWTGGATDDDYGDGEVRRRTRLLLAAAAAVVVLGVGAGWALTGTSSDDPCAGGRCATVGDLNSPAAEDEEAGDSDVPIEEATDTATPDPEASETGTPTTAPTTQTRVRPTRTASAEPTREPEPQPTRTRARSEEQQQRRDPEPEPTSRATRAQIDEIKEPEASARPEPKQVEEDTQPTSDPATEVPQPEETRRGLLDILFPWR